MRFEGTRSLWRTERGKSYPNLVQYSGLRSEVISQNGRGNTRQGKDLVHGPAKNSLSRHAKDHTTCFILRNRKRFYLLHFKQTVCTVVTHARHQNSHRAATRG